MIWALVGHRGSGKTTLGNGAAKLLRRLFIDLDERIERETGRSPAFWIADSQIKFRAVEIGTLDGIREPALVAPGAGIGEIPDRFAVVWLQRDGWEEVARTRRPRIRPDLSEDEELAWMKETRDPRYRIWADAILRIPRHETPEGSVRRLADLVERLENSCGSGLLRRSWWIGAPERVGRQIARTIEAGAAGVEIRTDRFDAAAVDRLNPDPERTLFSVRTESRVPASGRFSNVDVDLKCSFSLPQTWRSQHVIFSDHPVSLGVPRFPSGAENVKWAPSLKTFGDIPRYLSAGADLRSHHATATIVPQSPRWTWLRILEALRQNRWNYMSPDALAHESGAPPWSTWALYAHATPEAKLYGLVGESVESSPGAEYHNVFFRAACHDAVYVAVPVPPAELKEALAVLRQLPFQGLSVTSPHKKAVLDLPGVRSDALGEKLGSVNTLAADVAGGWRATNTDVAGMKATLGAVDRSSSARTLVIGRGGVSSSVLHALDESGIVFRQAGYRELASDPGVWSEPWDLVINTSGRNVSGGPPRKSRVWVDLRCGAAASNDGGEKFIAGEMFFEAQAEEQHRFWGLKREEDK